MYRFSFFRAPGPVRWAWGEQCLAARQHRHRGEDTEREGRTANGTSEIVEWLDYEEKTDQNQGRHHHHRQGILPTPGPPRLRNQAAEPLRPGAPFAPKSGRQT